MARPPNTCLVVRSIAGGDCGRNFYRRGPSSAFLDFYRSLLSGQERYTSNSAWGVGQVHTCGTSARVSGADIRVCPIRLLEYFTG